MREIGGYELVKQIGSGGMSTVYEAVNGGGDHVALKLLHPSLAADEESRVRLQREVAVLRRVRSPFIAEVIDAELDASEPFIVTELIHGVTLEQDVKENGIYTDEDLEALGKQLAQALDIVHAAGVVHRDLKPTNVMIENPAGLGDMGSGVRDAGSSAALGAAYDGCAKSSPFSLANPPTESGISPEGETLIYSAGFSAPSTDDGELGRTNAQGLGGRDAPANGRPILIDFGIAQQADSTRLTQQGSLALTPGYLDPRIYTGAAPDQAADWWALTAVLAYAATGVAPFGTGAPAVVMARVMHGEPNLPDLSAELSAAFRAALSPRLDERIPFGDLLEVVADPEYAWELDLLEESEGQLEAARAHNSIAEPANGYFPASDGATLIAGVDDAATHLAAAAPSGWPAEDSAEPGVMRAGMNAGSWSETRDTRRASAGASSPAATGAPVVKDLYETEADYTGGSANLRTMSLPGWGGDAANHAGQPMKQLPNWDSDAASSRAWGTAQGGYGRQVVDTQHIHDLAEPSLSVKQQLSATAPPADQSNTAGEGLYEGAGSLENLAALYPEQLPDWAKMPKKVRFTIFLVWLALVGWATRWPVIVFIVFSVLVFLADAVGSSCNLVRTRRLRRGAPKVGDSTIALLRLPFTLFVSALRTAITCGFGGLLGYAMMRLAVISGWLISAGMRAESTDPLALGLADSGLRGFLSPEMLHSSAVVAAGALAVVTAAVWLFPASRRAREGARYIGGGTATSRIPRVLWMLVALACAGAALLAATVVGASSEVDWAPFEQVFAFLV